MISRRRFLKTLRWAPFLSFANPLATFRSPAIAGDTGGADKPSFAFTEFRLTPHYPAKSPIDDLLVHVNAGLDEYVTEKYTFEIMRPLSEWAQALRASCPAIATIAEFLDQAVEATALVPTKEMLVRSENGIEVVRRQFAAQVYPGRDRLLGEIKTYFASMSRMQSVDFEIVGMEEVAGSSPTVSINLRYYLVGMRKDAVREQRIGNWLMQWSCNKSKGWQLSKWEATQETASRAREPVFIDITSHVLGETKSYRDQMLRGVDYWRSSLDSACGIEIYGNHGVAVGDVDNDGCDDFYVCQPAGLPNRLYRNRGDGEFEDVTEESGLGVLDATACALFADFENQGCQDLLVVCGRGPLLFMNQGKGKFVLKDDAFQFERPPQGTFTHAAIADYDRDGRLDIYFCLYNYYLGLDQYHYPVPYFDARNGPPNFLLHNEGKATFRDGTEAAGMNVDNDRYSFACAWGDYNSDGWPDLYVANDFGRNNLYRNNGDGTFSAIAREAGVEDVGAGMSACWIDFDNDGKQDLYVGNMWSAAGMRISQQKVFQQKEPEAVRALYRQHARGNSLYRNCGNGQFENVSSPAGVDVGGWSWSSDAWDFDHDGYPDLYIANGYISGPDTRDLGSFFWRHVVGKSPDDASRSSAYEQGWSAVNELIRSDLSWSGYEKNVFYLNNQNGTFSDISGIAGLDFPEDSRAFALADFDHDGRLELVLKNRNAPQLRILRNTMKEIGHSIAFCLRGQKSNRDAIGAAITVEAVGHRQTKYLQAGSGFLSQHTKELFFGVGKNTETVRAVVLWPSGLRQEFEHLPIDARIHIEEGSHEFLAEPFSAPPATYLKAGQPQNSETLPSSVETWLIQPLSAPEFSFPDLAGRLGELHSSDGGSLLLTFWTSATAACSQQLRLFQRNLSALDSKRLRIRAVNLDEHRDLAALRSFADKQGVTFPVLLGSDEVAGVYNILYRYLYDRHRDMPLPTSFLINQNGMMVKLYQGIVNPDRLLEDLRSASSSPAERIHQALPFGGARYYGEFGRNDFTYGVAWFQHGYLEEAAASFKQVITAKADDPEAYYNLGTLYLRRNDSQDARRYLEQTVKLRPNYPEAWNNLGMVAAQQGQMEDAVHSFQESLRLRPDYATALLNLGNIYRRQGNVRDAEKLLSRALKIEPDNAEVNYSVGMLYAQQDQSQRALEYFEKALRLRPDYPDALNNLGVVFVRERRFPEAEQRFKTCIEAAPQFDQAYLNLARLYVMLNHKEKARTVLQALLRLEPGHKIAQQMLELLH